MYEKQVVLHYDMAKGAKSLQNIIFIMTDNHFCVHSKYHVKTGKE